MRIPSPISSAHPAKPVSEVIYHENDGGSRESQALARYALETGRRMLIFKDWRTIPKEHIQSGKLVSGSVETLENLIGARKPEYFPQWTKPYQGRKIQEGTSDDVAQTGLPRFLKPSDKLKRFDGFLWTPGSPIPQGTLEIQEPVTILREGRHYILKGGVLASEWYSQEEDPNILQMTCPPLPGGLAIPENWSGTIDTAETLEYGIIVLECHQPFACGWYGESKDFMIYGHWLEEGWKSLLHPPETNP